MVKSTQGFCFTIIMLRICLFNGLRISLDEQPLRFSALPRASSLLAYLLLHRDQPISRDRLGTILWPEESESQSRANLRRHLYDLRRTLPPDPPGTPWMLAETKTLQWNPLAPSWLDVAEFERRAALPEERQGALDLYTGDLLPEVYDDWIFFERERLRSQFFSLLEDLVESKRQAGDFSAAIYFNRQIIARDPLREDAARSLMRLLYATGDRASALGEYQRLEKLLEEALGVPPMPETLLLYTAILQNQPLPDRPLNSQETRKMFAAASGGVSVTAPVPGSQSSSPTSQTSAGEGRPVHNVPSRLMPFFGRKQELLALQELLVGSSTPARLVTLTGPGGVGKTRLSIQTAHHLGELNPHPFPDGIFFIALTELASPQGVLSTIARAVELHEAGQHSLAAQLQTFLRPRRLLLVLDNFEHLLEAANHLSDLLSAAPGLHILVTSRSILNLYGEYELPVQPLPFPDPQSLPPLEELAAFPSVQIFVEAGRAVRPNFCLSEENARPISEICARLDGLPLALELAAARLKLFTPQAILTRIGERLDFLYSQARNLPERQRSLRAAIDWSCSLLNEAERLLFARLSVFTGSFSLSAAISICNPRAEITLDPPPSAQNDQITDRLLALVGQNMLRQEVNQPIDQEPHFRLLFVLREYARERLNALGAAQDGTQNQARDASQEANPGEAENMYHRHLAWYLALAEQARRHMSGENQNLWLGRLEEAHSNLLAALDWGLSQPDCQPGADLAAALLNFWLRRGRLSEGGDWLEKALLRCQDRQDERYLTLLRSLSSLCYTQGNFEKARRLQESCVALERMQSPPEKLAVSLNLLGMIHYGQSKYQLAEASFQEALGIQESFPALNLGAIGNLLNNLGLNFQRQGRFEEAKTSFERSLAAYRQVEHRRGIGIALNNLALLALEQGRFSEVRQNLEQSLEIVDSLGECLIGQIVRKNLGDLERYQGSLPGAEEAYQLALAAFSDLNAYTQLNETRASLALLCIQKGELSRARQLLVESLTQHQISGDRLASIISLEGLALASASQGQAERALQLFAAAAAERQALSAPLPPIDRPMLERAIKNARDQLGDPESTAAWQKGTGLSLEQAITLALTGG